MQEQLPMGCSYAPISLTPILGNCSMRYSTSCIHAVVPFPLAGGRNISDTVTHNV